MRFRDAVVAGRYRRLRAEPSFSQEKLAELAELHRTDISDIERAQKNISIDNIEILAKAFRCRIHRLLLDD